MVDVLTFWGKNKSGQSPTPTPTPSSKAEDEKVEKKGVVAKRKVEQMACTLAAWSLRNVGMAKTDYFRVNHQTTHPTIVQGELRHR